MRTSQRIVRTLARGLLPRRERERLAQLRIADAGHGYDLFGMHRDWVLAARALADPLYRRYFRVSSFGAENVPAAGPAILVANHAGTLPLDAAMLCMDVLEHTSPPRMPRCIVDRFVPKLPFVGASFSRFGAVNGTLANVRHLLQEGELCLIFPEGLPAIGKPFSARYELQRWHVGHAELALRLRVPVIPVAVIGSEEQWPQLGRLEWLRPFGIPYLPIPATPLPLPVHYRIHYGTPLELHGAEPSGELSALAIERAAATTQAAVKALVQQGLATRRGVFR
jgi:1-acyl-sn-glycerol-3-phosphate acyltransferase